jgi:hypothetical protein
MVVPEMLAVMLAATGTTAFVFAIAALMLKPINTGVVPAFRTRMFLTPADTVSKLGTWTASGAEVAAVNGTVKPIGKKGIRSIASPQDRFTAKYLSQPPLAELIVIEIRSATWPS